MTTPLEIPRPILEEIYREARSTFPAECCGWLAGPKGGSAVTRVRRCVNAQDSGTPRTIPGRNVEHAYVFTDAEAFELLRSLDSDEPAMVIYHSHPNGRAYFSETDRSRATWRDATWGDSPTYPVQQLVVGIDAERVVESALFAWSDEDNGFVEIARFEGARV